MSSVADACAWLRTWLGGGGRQGAARLGGALVVGVGLGLAVATGWWGQALWEGWTLQQTVEQMQAEHRRASSVVTAVDPSPAQPADPQWHGPMVSERDAAWLWLQQRLQAHGLKVALLRPDALQAGVVLASQTAQLRVHGAWADWMAFDRQVAEHAPWWQWLQWQVLPWGAAGQAQVEGRLRLWLRPEGAAGLPAQVWPVWPAAPARAQQRLFSDEPVNGPAVPAEAAASAAAWRLWGVWTQAEQTHVVLGRGTEWAVLAPGRTLGPEAYRLERVDAEGVRLKGQGLASNLFLPWETRP